MNNFAENIQKHVASVSDSFVPAKVSDLAQIYEIIISCFND